MKGLIAGRVDAGYGRNISLAGFSSVSLDFPLTTKKKKNKQTKHATSTRNNDYDYYQETTSLGTLNHPTPASPLIDRR
jgi:hypothetical protein